MKRGRLAFQVGVGRQHNLIDRFGAHWRVLLSHLVLFGFIYPSERSRVPARVLEELTERELLDIAATSTVLNASVTRFVRPEGTGPWLLDSFNMADHLLRQGAPVTEHAGDTDVHPT